MHKSRTGDDRLCEKCLGRKPLYGMARSFGNYEGKFGELIHLYKYRGKTQLGKPFGILAFSVFMQHWKQTDTEIMATPVPLHIKDSGNAVTTSLIY